MSRGWWTLDGVRKKKKKTISKEEKYHREIKAELCTAPANSKRRQYKVKHCRGTVECCSWDFSRFFSLNFALFTLISTLNLVSSFSTSLLRGLKGNGSKWKTIRRKSGNFISLEMIRMNAETRKIDRNYLNDFSIWLIYQRHQIARMSQWVAISYLITLKLLQFFIKYGTLCIPRDSSKKFKRLY